MNLPWLEPSREQINSALVEQRFGHAPLVSGPEGVGKQDLVTWLVGRILCLQPDSGQPCGSCRSCQLLASGSHPDFFRVAVPEDKKEIPVDAVRELSASLHLTPRIGTNRVGLIHVAEALNINAANALLKTLEEPADNAWLILLSHQPGRLPATIRSRCQPVSVRPPTRDVALEWLADQCPEQDRDQLIQALSLSAEAPLAARQLLQNEGLDFGLEILDGLLEVARGRPVSSLVSERWLQAPARTWNWLALWTSVFMRHGQSLESEQLPLGTQLPAGLDQRTLAGLWQQALAGRAMASGNVRQDLLLGKWLLEWETMNQSGNPN